MKVFIAASYSSKVDYETGEVYPEYKRWLEEIINSVSSLGHSTFCALVVDNFKINNENPSQAFSLDVDELKKCDVILALLSSTASTGVQTEIGVGIALGKKVILAHSQDDPLTYFNKSIIDAGAATELLMPFSANSLANAII